MIQKKYMNLIRSFGNYSLQASSGQEFFHTIYVEALLPSLQLYLIGYYSETCIKRTPYYADTLY